MTDIFVFGSNTAGRHGKGAALAAREKWGAIQGQAEGLQGRSYAIPTRSYHRIGRGRAIVATLPLEEIEEHVFRFLTVANEHPELTFRVTPIGCGLAGYRFDEIGPMFKGAPDNVVLPPEFQPYVA